MTRPDSHPDERAARLHDEAASRLRGSRIPSSVYRLQLSADFPFSRAARVVPYLRELGIGDLYLSPYLRAAPGSAHGYDVVAHDEISPELGGAEGLELLAAALREHGMGHLLDFVPNHMGIGKDNALWQDLLENGPSSHYARFFDVVWKPVKAELENKVLLPVLGDQYGAVLEAGDLQLELVQGTFSLRYYDHVFPINPRHYPSILRHRLDELSDDDGGAKDELLSICTACDNLPSRTETDPEKVAERRREKEVIKRRLDALCQASPLVSAFIERNVRDLNGTRGDSASFDLLDRLLDEQAYRLAHWRVAGEEINYRRFFDVNDLAAIRMEDPEVFGHTHRLVLKLLADGLAQGMRIDHPDGLFDPKAYFRRLQEEHFVETCRRIAEEEALPFDELEPRLRSMYELHARDGRDARPLYVVIEKILGLGERLPDDWAVEGTTGYEFLNSVNGLFVDPANLRAIDDVFSRFTGLRLDLGELVYRKKKLIMSTSMASEVNILAFLLNRVSEMNRRSRDFTLNALRSAIVEYVACFPVYRSYVTAKGVDDRDRRYVEQAISAAKRRSPVTNVSIFDFLRNVLLLRHGAHLGDEEKRMQLDFAMKLQQLTGPVMAKGLEDTSFYVFNRLVSLNEVGGEPRHFGTSPEEFHAQNAERLMTARGSLLATTTHDSKRSEDVRARIDVLSELPGEWKSVLARLSKAARRHRVKVGADRVAPDRNEELMLYQSLIGAWPFGELDTAGRQELTARFDAWALKAAKEAKVNTSWINPDVAWDEALSSFVRRILADDAFLRELLPFQRKVARVGIHNSLAQLLLKLVSPGVPDIYQGCESWSLSLVDPDNRRPIDFDGLAARLDEIRSRRERAADGGSFARELWERREDGDVKQFVTWRALQLRRGNPALFLDGDYVPVDCGGPRAQNVVAICRRRGFQQVIAVVPRLVARLLDEVDEGRDPWEGSYLLLPGGSGGASWTCALTGAVHRPIAVRRSATLPLSALFRDLPVALLQLG
ncbi:malto-oligosyltrehalose synthase [Vulgatibacter incomptus]|uniref:Malto-oligosyltrehalose synthase n=1 Tax=Vulgatibacter incomptus TaxID=1391653 RepID=A0A0K1PD38_9BACT|nr:malto-oligosyltrehalose synthase [Vulgatibacter incomptus]AKU91435.1 Malto-oligosyltrehalose synthase [Vulgatibacter incomptus]